jgi:hypothetical protein
MRNNREKQFPSNLRAIPSADGFRESMAYRIRTKESFQNPSFKSTAIHAILTFVQEEWAARRHIPLLFKFKNQQSSFIIQISNEIHNRIPIA